ncbi:MAG: AAA family ATPase [Alphaproteobacteria bacterium]|nr:AAA family ATPase [Alphaproteobacteria bacterium]
MNLPPATTEALTAEEIAEIRAQAQAAVAEFPTVTAAAVAADVKYTTFHGWLRDAYSGDNAAVALKVRRWLAARRDAAGPASALPEVPGWLPTPTAAKIMPILQFAQIATSFTLIAGEPGLSKTCTAKHYRDITPHVWIVQCEPSMSSVNPLLQAICREMGIAERMATRLSWSIGQHVAGRRGLLIVDEAQFLDVRALEQLRTFPEKYGLGVALLGNRSVFARIQGGGNTDRSQLSSRLSMRDYLRAAQLGDIVALLDAWGVSDDEERKFLAQVAKKPGALRNLTLTLSLASTVAAGASRRRDLGDIRSAWAQLSGDMSGVAA